MKKILIFLASTLVAASCSSDIFDVDSTQRVSQETLDQINKKDPEKVLRSYETSIYTHYATYSNGDHWMTGLPGFYLSFGMSGQDLPLLMQHSMNFFMYDLDYYQEDFRPTKTLWNMFYIPLSTTNKILKTATKEAAAESEALTASRARALTSRAFALYNLINIYQFRYSETTKNELGVPLPDETTGTQNMPRATMDKVYERIIGDLDEALELFKQVNYNDLSSRTDFDWSVAALIRARVALIMEDWTLAASLADDILAKYPLLGKEDFNNGFNQIRDVPSTLFGFVMSADNSQSFASWVSQMDPYMSGYAGLWAERPIHSYLYESMNQTDVRRGWWLNKTDNPNPGAGEDDYPCMLPSNLSNIEPSGVQARSEYVSVKFRGYKGDWNSSDLIYMRAEEAVFIKAEAEAHSNLSAAKATLKDYVTTYRDPAYDIEATMLEDVVLEIFRQKRIELWMESGIEYFDRRRLNLSIDRREDPEMKKAGIENNHLVSGMWTQDEAPMRWQLPRDVVIGNPLIGEANQN